MPQTEVLDPIRGPDAFRGLDGEAVQSQAAILVYIGRRLRGDDAALRARAAAAGLAAVRATDEAAEEEDDEFPLPPVQPTPARVSPERVRLEMPRTMAEAAATPPPARPTRAAGTARVAVTAAETTPDAASSEFRAQVAEQLYVDGAPHTTAVLLEASLLHYHELVRVAAASAYLELSEEPGRPLAVLEEGTRSLDELTCALAATALARYEPDNLRLRELQESNPAPTGEPPSNTALMVHGTWARGGLWWQPGGDFHTFVRGFRPDLYAGADRFEWSGGYSEAARQLAAAQLRTWVRDHGLEGLDVFAHSHGANIAMLATNTDKWIRVGCLVLLSCPVHVHRYFPDFRRVGKGVVSVRVKRDIVIAADGGGQRFGDPRIHEHVLPIWFDHAASHKPKVWERHRVRDRIDCGSHP